MCYITLLVITTVKGLPSGAPTSACEDGTDLVPSHFYSPSTDPLPYEVDISLLAGQTYIPDKTYNSKYHVFSYFKAYRELMKRL